MVTNAALENSASVIARGHDTIGVHAYGTTAYGSRSFQRPTCSQQAATATHGMDTCTPLRPVLHASRVVCVILQIPGVIGMELVSAAAPEDDGVYDPRYAAVVTIFNCAPTPVTLAWPVDTQGPLALHPDLTAATCGDARLAECSADADARTLTVAARTTAVFVQLRDQ